MTPSGKARGKGPVAERHLLAYKCAVAGLQKRSGPWTWEADDPEIDQVRQFLRDYKNGERCPSGWTQSTAIVAVPQDPEEVDDDQNADSPLALVDKSQELDEWRSGKRRREEGHDVETGETFSLVTTTPANGAASSSSAKTPIARLVEVKTEAAENKEEADTLASQQHQFIDFKQQQIDDLKALALAWAPPDKKHQVMAIVNRQWRDR